MTDEVTAGALVLRQLHGALAKREGRPSPATTALLAQLRRGVGRAPGSLPEIWGVTLEGIPDTVEARQRARLETAVHVALTHYALHQQAQDLPMHVQQRSFGAAIRALAENQTAPGQDVHETPVYRRFVAMAAAQQLEAVLVHVRGLITQLRAAHIGFNYARFADQLVDLQDPRRASQVRRQWGRDFHRVTTTDGATADSSTTTDNPSTEGDQS